MSNNRTTDSHWPRHADEDVAVDRLLDAAGRAFATLGVAKATMVDVAAAAGCSRATLYRYFPNQEALHLAFVHRATLRTAAYLAGERRAGAPNSLADRVIAGLASVRSDPAMSEWFEPENMAVPIKVSQNSELLRTMSAGLLTELGPTHIDEEELERRAEWLLRSIISLLAMPGRDAASERAMVESFLVPVLLVNTHSKA
ncbi:MAG: TetR family transcriptional regulator [Acidimicrobiales bacterium]|nr:MAG: TetR family transcriptional regulator [Acidimicrobiales bacterium]